MAERGKACNQLEDYKKSRSTMQPDQMTTATGAPIADKLNVMTVGPRGPLLMQDVVFMEEMAHFDRERIPERVVHAKGGGAYGYFEVTHDITKYCKAKIFEQIGKKTPMFIRMSTVGGERGSADSARDPRGFAMKFYTEDGNWDLVGNNTPIFFIRDTFLFPSFIHTQKRNPRTHLKDPDMFWDFISLRPETIHQVSYMYTGRGTPYSYRNMNGYGSHTYKMVNAAGEAVYCKFHFKTNQGIKNLTRQESDYWAGADPDRDIRDLYESIASGNFPSWTCYIQVMTFEEAERFRWNPFDVTKVWPHAEYPLIPVGRFILNRNPKNYFAEVEQSAFCPSHMVPGIEPSPDKMLQGRLFSYSDTHRHRLGTNYLQFPVNCAYNAKVRNFQRDGPQCFDNQDDAPNYYPNSFSGPETKSAKVETSFKVSGDVGRYNSSDDDNFTQTGILWNKVLKEPDRAELVDNIAAHLCNAQEFIQQRAVRNFSQADPEYGRRVQERLNFYKAEKKKAAKL